MAEKRNLMSAFWAGLIFASTMSGCGEVGCDPAYDSWCEEKSSSSNVLLSSSSVRPSSSSAQPPLSSSETAEQSRSSSSVASSSSSSTITDETYYCIKNGICLQGLFSLSQCSTDIGGLPSNSCNGNSSSSSSNSSSSSVPSSSSFSLVSCTNPVVSNGSLTCGGQTYKTVVIGTQTWMAENLNYVVEGSKCYNNLESNCTTYGRLYNWSMAMGLPSSCNDSYCSGQIQSPHRGICPYGWHIPSREDWGKLSRYVDGTSGTPADYISSTAGRYLKAASGWYGCGPSGSGRPYFCEDTYGFSALPGGYGNSDGSFDYVGSSGNGWSASEYRIYSAYYRYMSYDQENAYWRQGSKFFLLSVRCLQDSDEKSSSSALSSSSSTSYSGSYGSVVYEGQTYKTVVIGTQTWMAENLNYAVEGSKCYNNSESNCTTYGRLYDWSMAMGLPSSCNDSYCSGQIQSPHRGICPAGWHIPSDADWDKLFRYVDGTSGTSSPYYDSPTAGRYLKATLGWYDCGLSGSGSYFLCEDVYGFSALPGGNGFSDDSFAYLGDYGNWLSTSEDEYSRYSTDGRVMSYDFENAYWGSSSKFTLSSVRCLKD